ncbi:MAG: hypothetical protein M1832_001563 [Thelocarpon impressellum]|nr:MAG: hypothetical protein M1832_001563 [Thelocarpon impressellum]
MTHFGPNDGYKGVFIRPNTPDEHTIDAVLYQVVPLALPLQVSTEFAERQVVMMDCKLASLDTPSAWDQVAAAQLSPDLRATSNAAGRLFGILTIERRARFFSFDAADDPLLTPLHEGVLDVADDAGINEVERWRAHTKQRAWEWCAEVAG